MEGLVKTVAIGVVTSVVSYYVIKEIQKREQERA